MFCQICERSLILLLCDVIYGYRWCDGPFNLFSNKRFRFPVAMVGSLARWKNVEFRFVEKCRILLRRKKCRISFRRTNVEFRFVEKMSNFVSSKKSMLFFSEALYVFLFFVWLYFLRPTISLFAIYWRLDGMSLGVSIMT